MDIIAVVERFMNFTAFSKEFELFKNKNKTCGQTQACMSESNLLVFFGHPLVPTVEHIQPFGFSLPEHVWRNIITASRENKKRLDHLPDISACKNTHTYKFMHVRKCRVGNREPVLAQNRRSRQSFLLKVMVHLICVFKKYFDSVFCKAIQQQSIVAIESTMAVLISLTNHFLTEPVRVLLD